MFYKVKGKELTNRLNMRIKSESRVWGMITWKGRILSW